MKKIFLIFIAVASIFSSCIYTMNNKNSSYEKINGNGIIEKKEIELSQFYCDKLQDCIRFYNLYLYCFFK